MEPQIMVEHYKIDLTDDHAKVVYYKERLEVGDFINDINWAHVRHFSVEPVEPLAEWELELLNSATAEAETIDIVERNADGDITARGYDQVVSQVEEEWRVIEALPIRSFEINRDGVIRHRASKRVMDAFHFDIDQNAYRTDLIVNGQEFSVYGPSLAKAMWGREHLCSNPQCNTKKGHDGPCPPWGWSGHEVRKTDAP